MSFFKKISTNSSSDQVLVNLYKQSGDLTLLTELFQRYVDLLYAVCLKYLKESEMAKDAVMDIFEELAVKLKNHEVANFKGWLYTVAKNHCLMKLRSAKHMKTNEFDPEHMQLTEEVHLNGVMEQEANLNRLTKCLESLAEEQKQAIELFYMKKKCYKEIAEQTGLEWNRVRSHIQNGRRNLKNCLEQQAIQYG